MTSTTSERIAAAAAAAAGASASPPAWHPDPIGRFRLRYWDGSSWTARVVHGEQVGVDRGWPDPVTAPATATATIAQPAAAASLPAALSATTAPLPQAATAPVAPVAPVAPIAPEPVLIDPEPADPYADPLAGIGPGAVTAVDLGPGPGAPAPPADDDDEASEPHPPARFDVSPAAVMGPRPGRAGPAAPPVEAPAATTATAPPVAASAAHATPGAVARAVAGKESLTEAASGLAGTVRRVVTGWRVAALLAVIALGAIAATPMAWKSAERSFDAQEAWEVRAEEWQVRAGDHADERDEAIALIGQSRARNRTLTEEIAELERQIEELAAANASLTDENQLMRDALASLGYQGP